MQKRLKSLNTLKKYESQANRSRQKPIARDESSRFKGATAQSEVQKNEDHSKSASTKAYPIFGQQAKDQTKTTDRATSLAHENRSASRKRKASQASEQSQPLEATQETSSAPTRTDRQKCGKALSTATARRDRGRADAAAGSGTKKPLQPARKLVSELTNSIAAPVHDQMSHESKAAVLHETAKSEPTNPRKPVRRRLIDSLAEQAEPSDSSDSSDGEASAYDRRATTAPLVHDLAIARGPVGNTPRQPPLQPQSRAPSASIQRTGVLKHKYSSASTLRDKHSTALARSELSGSHMDDLIKSTPGLETDAFGFGGIVDDEPGTAQTAIRSVHELRRAGANNRFADEINDIMERIGRPGPKSLVARRNALLDLAQRLQRKDFLRRFCDHGTRDDLFESVGSETDLLCGFLLLSITTTLLETQLASHLVVYLRSQGLVTLIKRLISEKEDIVEKMRSQRPKSLSNAAMESLSMLGTSLRVQEFWGDSRPDHLLPPRLVCLGLISASSKFYNASDFAELVFAVTDDLLKVLEEASPEGQFSGCRRPEETFALAALEAYSNKAIESGRTPEWGDRYPPIIAALLSPALSSPMTLFKDSEGHILSLALNITNKNPAATTQFVQDVFLRRLAVAIDLRFAAIKQATADDASYTRSFKDLVLMINLMINIMADWPQARAFDDNKASAGESSLLPLILIFIHHHASMNEVGTRNLARSGCV